MSARPKTLQIRGRKAEVVLRMHYSKGTYDLPITDLTDYLYSDEYRTFGELRIPVREELHRFLSDADRELHYQEFNP